MFTFQLKKLRFAENNAAEIEAFEDALFVLALDNAYPVPAGQSREEANMLNAVHGGGSAQNTPNRWFDKCLNLYVNTNGAMGLCYEHTPAEGPPVAGLLEYCQDRFKQSEFVYVTEPAATQPLKLNWRLTELDRQTLMENYEKNDQ